MAFCCCRCSVYLLSILLLLFLLLYLLSFRMPHCDHHRQHIQPASSPHILSLHPRTINWCLVRFRLVFWQNKNQSHELKCIDPGVNEDESISLRFCDTGICWPHTLISLVWVHCFGYVFVLFFYRFVFSNFLRSHIFIKTIKIP